MSHIIVIRDNGGDRIIGFLGLDAKEFVESVCHCSPIVGKAVFRGLTESKGNFIARAKAEFGVSDLPGVSEAK